MTDIKSKEARSANMRAVKGKDTAPEIFVRKLMWHAGIRYFKNYRALPGKPDAYLPRWRVAVFVNGCFWHRHPGCPQATTPKAHREFWLKKFARTRQRDVEERLALNTRGIRVLTVCECSVKRAQRSAEEAEKLLEDIEKFLRGSDSAADL